MRLPEYNVAHILSMINSPTELWGYFCGCIHSFCWIVFAGQLILLFCSYFLCLWLVLSNNVSLQSLSHVDEENNRVFFFWYIELDNCMLR